MRGVACVLLIIFLPLGGQDTRGLPKAPQPGDPLRVPRPAPPSTIPIADRKKGFLQAYDKLIAALNEFSEAYYQQREQAMPLDKVNAVKKAWKDLQRAEPAFK
jgi:hypothetical protein